MIASPSIHSWSSTQPLSPNSVPPSSSRMVNSAPVTAPAPWLFRAVAVTVTARSPEITSLSIAVISAVSAALAVAPAAIVMVASEPTV